TNLTGLLYSIPRSSAHPYDSSTYALTWCPPPGVPHCWVGYFCVQEPVWCITGRLVVGKTPALKKTATKTVGRPERAVRRRRPLWSTQTDDEDEDDGTDDAAPSVGRPKKDTARTTKRPKVVKTDKEAYPDEDSTAVPSDWFVYRELKKCLKCASSRIQGGAVCRMYQGEPVCRRCKRTSQGCYWEISPGAIPVSYSGGHKQTRDAATVAARADSLVPPPPPAALFVPHSEATRPAFRVDDISYVEEVPSCLAAIRRRAALARVHPASHPASRAIADVVEQSLANAQVQMTTGLLLARSLIRDRAPGFRGPEDDPQVLDEPIDDDRPVDFTEDTDHPVLFRLATPPLDASSGRVPSSPTPSIPARSAGADGPSTPAGSRSPSDAALESSFSKVATPDVAADADGFDGDAEGVEVDAEDDAIVSGEEEAGADV
ncbi:hypothetical protein EUX98_g9782, partial [Antrodiella citrinella]